MGFWRAVVTSSVAVVCGVGLCATAAGASESGPNGPGTPIIGNVVGGISPADRTTLGADADGCTATVEVGRGGGRFGAPVVHHYTIPGLNDPSWCPDMGVAVHDQHSRVRDLAVTWFDVPPFLAHQVYVLRHLSVLSGSVAESFPSVIGTRDFNGDGQADIWEWTDEGEGVQTFLRQGRGFVQGPAVVSSQFGFGFPVFGRLDNTPGTDIADFYVSLFDQPGLPGSAGAGVLVVDGATGRNVVLERDLGFEVPCGVAIVDANHDGHNDVQVSGNRGNCLPGRTRVYLGDGLGHYHLQR